MNYSSCLDGIRKRILQSIRRPYSSSRIVVITDIYRIGRLLPVGGTMCPILLFKCHQGGGDESILYTESYTKFERWWGFLDEKSHG